MTGDLQLAALNAGLVRHFHHVAQTRMDGVPIVDPAIEVEAVGFEHTADGCLGVLITPWFINLILLPCEGGDWHDRPPGGLQRHRFASGDYEFRHVDEHPIGRYQTCSLLSPLLEIPDQRSAVAFARAALAALHDPEQQGTESGTRSAEIGRRWSGADPADSPPASAPLSRRAFLVGRAHAESGRPG